MNDFQARIRRVRMKNGGADVHVIHREEVNANGEDWRGNLVDASRKIAALGTDEAPLVGYFVIGMYADGATSTGFRHDPERAPIPKALMPAWIAEVVRRDLITEKEARAVFDDMFRWEEGR